VASKPVIDAHLKLDLVALNEIVSVLISVRDLRNAPMIGAAILDLDLTLLNPGLLIGVSYSLVESKLWLANQAFRSDFRYKIFRFPGRRKRGPPP